MKLPQLPTRHGDPLDFLSWPSFMIRPQSPIRQMAPASASSSCRWMRTGRDVSAPDATTVSRATGSEYGYSSSWESIVVVGEWCVAVTVLTMPSSLEKRAFGVN